MSILLQRICWNEHLWVRPSGLPKDAGYPREQRFGWDEWSFNLDDAFKASQIAVRFIRGPYHRC